MGGGKVWKRLPRGQFDPVNPQDPKKKKKKKRRSIPGMILRFIGCVFCVGIMLCSVGGVLLSMYIVQVTADDGEVLDLDNQKNKQTTIIYDKNGNEYATLTQGENRIWRELSAMPEKSAACGHRHRGQGLLPRARHQHQAYHRCGPSTSSPTTPSTAPSRGASTLEQQLVKNLTATMRWTRCVRCAKSSAPWVLPTATARRPSWRAYLNTIPLTGIVCGMEAGAQEYFGKHVEDLTLSECAVLASITKNPTAYNPFTNPENLITRRNHVLYEMYTQGYITEDEYNSACAETITLTEIQQLHRERHPFLPELLLHRCALTMSAQRSAGEAEHDGGRGQVDDLQRRSAGLLHRGPRGPDGHRECHVRCRGQHPALWHEEAVCLRDYPADTSSWDEVQFDENTGLPLTKDGLAVYGVDDIPVYTDDEHTTLKMGTSTDDNYPNDDTEYLCVYETVRTQAAIATLDYERQHPGYRRRCR